MKQLKTMKETLTSCVQGQLSDLRSADAQELGAAIDMIKDLSEAIYYCTITEAMEKEEKSESQVHYYTTPIYPPYYCLDRDMDKDYYSRMYYTQPRDSQGRFTEDHRGGRNYYDGNNGGSNSGNGGNRGSSSSNSSSGGSGGRSYFWDNEREMDIEWRDAREGRSGKRRRKYMESKEMHQDKATKIKELEHYMQELGEDLVEMIDGASPEEKTLLENKLSTLTSKISNLKNG